MRELKLSSNHQYAGLVEAQQQFGLTVQGLLKAEGVRVPQISELPVPDLGDSLKWVTALQVAEQFGLSLDRMKQNVGDGLSALLKQKMVEGGKASDRLETSVDNSVATLLEWAVAQLTASDGRYTGTLGRKVEPDDAALESLRQIVGARPAQAEFNARVLERLEELGILGLTFSQEQGHIWFKVEGARMPSGKLLSLLPESYQRAIERGRINGVQFLAQVETLAVQKARHTLEQIGPTLGAALGSTQGLLGTDKQSNGAITFTPLVPDQAGQDFLNKIEDDFLARWSLERRIEELVKGALPEGVELAACSDDFVRIHLTPNAKTRPPAVLG